MYFLRINPTPSTLLKLVKLASMLYMEKHGLQDIQVEIDMQDETISIKDEVYTFYDLIG